jgi:hypothetical protein
MKNARHMVVSPPIRGTMMKDDRLSEIYRHEPLARLLNGIGAP